MRGPPPKPTALKLIQGNPGKRPLNEKEPKPAAAIPEPPESVRSDEIAFAEWNLMAPVLSRLGILTEIDGSALAQYCRAFSLVECCTAMIERDGMFVEHTNKFGAVNVVSHPALRELRNAEPLMGRALAKLGMTPADRSRIRAEGAGVESAFEKWMKGQSSQ